MTELRETQPNYRQYPLPLATYDEVVRNPKVFIDTLEKLHAKMGTKFMVPTIGGRELDLHRLFVEVTSRGGIDKIAWFHVPRSDDDLVDKLVEEGFLLQHLIKAIKRTDQLRDNLNCFLYLDSHSEIR